MEVKSTLAFARKNSTRHFYPEELYSMILHNTEKLMVAVQHPSIDGLNGPVDSERNKERKAILLMFTSFVSRFLDTGQVIF